MITALTPAGPPAPGFVVLAVTALICAAVYVGAIHVFLSELGDVDVGVDEERRIPHLRHGDRSVLCPDCILDQLDDDFFEAAAAGLFDAPLEELSRLRTEAVR